MTTLVLTIYPRLEKVGRIPEPGYVVGKKQSHPARWADRLAEAKRFSDAELAAEYWAACTNCATVFPRPVGEWERAETIHRFATHPHYYEETE